MGLRHESLTKKKRIKKAGRNSNINFNIQSYYLSPEVATFSYDEKCDIWSCGVILYMLISATPPFDGDNDK
jgi:serine/threonine protein kinase